VYTDIAAQSVREFQVERGLAATGRCDVATWQALVESDFTLGDRMLHWRTPMLRGDDVAELQRRLGAFGFDAGRVDGILGPDTAAAVSDFQRNCGLAPDGIFGPDVLLMMDRLSTTATTGDSVAHLREAERMHTDRALSDLRVAVGETGGLGTVSRLLQRAIRRTGAQVVGFDDETWHRQAQAANRYNATVFVALTADGGPGCIAYYGTDGFTSTGGRLLAELLHEDLRRVIALDPPIAMRSPILRETRMPAVLINFGSCELAIRMAQRLAGATTRSLQQWIAPFTT
jgi:N-acetylmuramoyl-L-alanine amidase